MLTIRTGVQTTEIEQLVDLLHEAEEDDQRIRDALGNAAYEVHSGWIDGHLVGAAVVDWTHDPDSEILYIAVREKHRGKGYGRELLHNLMAELDKHGRRLVVGTANSSLDNIAFYQRSGFRMDSVKRGHFDYVQPEVTEFDIPLRDMLVFAYERPTSPAPEEPDPVAVDPGILDEVEFVLIPGSTRAASRNNAALRAVHSLAPRSVLYDRLAFLPQFDPDADPESDAEVSTLRATLAASDVVVISTPEYAGSLPGSMKNLIDWTVGTSDLHQKPVAWINVAATGRGTGAGKDLAHVLSYVDAQVLIPGGLQLPLDPGFVGAQGEITDQGYVARLLKGVVEIADAYKRTTHD